MKTMRGMSLLFGMVILFMMMYGITPAAAQGNGHKPDNAVSSDNGDTTTEPGDNGGVDNPDKPGKGPKSKDEINGNGQGLPDNKPGRDRSPVNGNQGNISEPGDNGGVDNPDKPGKGPKSKDETKGNGQGLLDNKPGRDRSPVNGGQGNMQQHGQQNPPAPDSFKPGQPDNRAHNQGPQHNCCGSCCNSAPGPKPQPNKNPDNKPGANQSPDKNRNPQANQGPRPDKNPQAVKDNKPRCQVPQGQQDKRNPGSENRIGNQGGRPDSPQGMDKGNANFDKAEHRNEHGKPDFKNDQQNSPKNNGHKK